MPVLVVGWIVSWSGPLNAQPGSGDQATNEIRIVELQGTVEVLPKGAVDWVITQTNYVLPPFARLRTRANSRVALRWSDQSVVPFGALTEMEILPPHAPEAQSGLRLIRGILSFFHRDKPGRIRVITRGTVAGVEGTEFVLAVEALGDTERTTLSLIDGRVQFGNEQGTLVLTNGQQAVAELGKAPVLTAGFIANNILQWAFYYPAMLDLGELPLSEEALGALDESLASYRAGDLLAALAQYPAGRQPGSDAERVYHAALLLSVGQVEQTETLLNKLNELNELNGRLAGAERTLIAAVKRQPSVPTLDPRLATELLASSYHQQSRAVGEDSLKSALRLARQAAVKSPEFGFAWARVAELEFSFGHTGGALEALDKSLKLSPRNAQALALKGFLLAAQNKTRDALDWFNRALAVDSALGNAWLGRGLCRIRRGETRGGREDLLVAAALEPQRSLLRSYLGKSYSESGDNQRATAELALARTIDTNDPTPWLYTALINREENRINEAVRDLERSIELNDNRALYRSRLLLDEDRAVRSSSLANLYQSAGMREVSVREAARGVSYDYANYSSHLFLSDSFNALRDPSRFNLRYETAWFNELLLANLLSPVGGTPLSQHISQQEYSRLFERNRIGLSSDSSYRSDGQYRELASQFGAVGNIGWSLDLDYQHNDGVRPNDELERIEWYSQVKVQLTPTDALFFLIKYQDYHSGDNFQYFDWRQGVRTNFTFDEYQTPIAVGGYHHEWSPRAHTLLLAGHLQNDQRFSDRATPELVLFTLSNKVTTVASLPFDVDYRSEFEAYTAELSQIFQAEHQTLVFGGRFQTGQFETRNRFPAVIFTNFFPITSTNSTDDFERATAYAYYTIEPARNLFLTAGLSYDTVTFPENHRNPPIFSGEERKDLFAPKAALVYDPLDWLTLRGIYTRSLGGVSLDQSYRLEPTQLAGFIQTFRSVIPESVAGSISAPTFETYGAALDLKFKSDTYIGIQAEMLSSEVHRQIGVFDFHDLHPPILPASTRERLEFDERSMGITLNQLFSDQWSAGVSYRFTTSELSDHLLDTDNPVVIRNGFTNANNTARSDLHHLGAYLLFNHPAGFFARGEANWFAQDNILHTYATNSARIKIELPSDEFPRFNVYIGWRFPRQRGDMTFGVLNVGGDEYHLNPLNSYPELPHERVYAAQLRLRF